MKCEVQDPKQLQEQRRDALRQMLINVSRKPNFPDMALGMSQILVANLLCFVANTLIRLFEKSENLAFIVFLAAHLVIAFVLAVVGFFRVIRAAIRDRHYKKTLRSSADQA